LISEINVYFWISKITFVDISNTYLFWDIQNSFSDIWNNYFGYLNKINGYSLAIISHNVTPKTTE